MLLKSLEIQGFKSFPDKTLLTFGDGITAVVGPNGSGKSNIADAIRWVLGEQSTKTLRGGRMEDVIFGGTVNRKPQGFAEVSLTIDNSARLLALDSDEVTVTRRYYRSGESDYLLNKNNVRLRDVYELFMDTGLGRDGYSIIGQGRIAEIVAAKSEDRREIFEEAAGISKFRYKKEESERRLAAAQENLLRLRDILTELEQRIGPLREQADKAKEFLGLSEEKKSLEVGLWVLALDKQRAALRENENKLELARAQYDGYGTEIEAIERQLEEIYTASQQKAAEAEDLRRDALSLQESAMQQQTAAEILQNDIAHNNENREQLQKEIADAGRQGGEAQAELTTRRAALLDRQRQHEELQKALALCQAGLTELLQQSEQYAGRLSETSAQLTELTSQLSQAALQKHDAEMTLQTLSERGDTLQERLRQRGEAQQAAKNELAAIETDARQNEEHILELKNALGGYELKLNSRREKLAAAEEQERSVSLKLSEKTQRAAMLQDLEKHLEGFAHSVKLVVRESERGALRGIHGPVSRLLHVPGQYAVAVETALGGALQNIVTDDEESAKAAIRFLKQTNGGRATFLPLTSVRGSLAEGYFDSYEGYLGILSELVSFEPVYRGVARSLLGRTLLAQDLDAAVSMARAMGYRYRIVTLDGQLVNAGGSLTGGSRSSNTGLLSRAGEIERLQTEAEQIRDRLRALTDDKKRLLTEVSSLEASVSGLRGESATAQEEKIRLAGEYRRVEGIVASLDTELAAAGTEQAVSEQKAQAARLQLEQAGGQMAKAEEQAAGLREELSRLGGGRDELQKRRDEQSTRETQLRLDLVTAGKDLEQLREGIASLEQAQTDKAAHVQALEERAAELQKRIDEAQSGIAERKDQALALRQKAAEQLKRCEGLAQERAQVEQSATGLRQKERALSDDKEKVSQDLTRLEERKAAAQSDYDAVVAKLWDEYELTRSQAEPFAAAITDQPRAQRRLNELKNKIRSLGSVNVSAIDEYKEVSERYEFMSRQVEDVEKARDELNTLIAGLTARMRSIFSEQFEAINHHFSETFVELFGGGKAFLRLTEPEDVLTSGIEINVQPPGKIIKSLTALSGGEQAFVAIALYFAILKVRPSPFCVLDEIEAALDDANVSRFAAYLRKMCGDTQFIVITHRRGTMDEADVLYGVTMQEEGVSKLLTLNVSQLAQKLGIA